MCVTEASCHNKCYPMHRMQEKHFIVSVMWAHCLTLPVGLHRLKDYGVMPNCDAWNTVAYAWLALSTF